jgi:hypothetical protein
MQMFGRSSGISLDTTPSAATQQPQSSNPNGPSENVVQILLNDIRVTMAKDPSKSYSARLGRSAADNSRDKSVFPLSLSLLDSAHLLLCYRLSPSLPLSLSVSVSLSLPLSDGSQSLTRQLTNHSLCFMFISLVISLMT